MQKVTFSYEILIHDDASPDNTADIIREYEAQYPDIIKPIYQTENQYSQGIAVSKLNLERARGKYIAHCEGDDYWLDPQKLQKQVDFLEQNPEYIGSAHNVKVINEDGSDVPKEINQYPHYGKHIFRLEDTEYSRLAGQSASLVYRNYYSVSTNQMLDEYYQCRGIGDRKVAVLLTLMGDIYCFDDVMSAYRYVTASGTSWSARTKGKNQGDLWNNYYIDMINFSSRWFPVTLHFEPLMIINALGAWKRVMLTGKIEDIIIACTIISQPDFWRKVIPSIFIHPLGTLQRCIRILRLPKVSAVTY